MSSVQMMSIADADGNGAEISIIGLNQLRKDLWSVDKKLNYKLNARLKRIGEYVAGEARMMTGRLAYVNGEDGTGRPSPLAKEADEMVAGIKVKGGSTSSRRGQSLVKVVQETRLGAIVEFADTPHSTQGKAFVDLLNRRATTGRFVWKAADKNRAYIFAQVEEAVRTTEAELQARLDG